MPQLYYVLLFSMIKKTDGFSLLEVVIFTGVFAIFFVTALSITTAFLRDMKFNEHKITGAHYASEVLEWIRSEAEVDWQSFATNRAASGGMPWCFNSNPINGWPGLSGACPSYGLVGLYKRDVKLTKNLSGSQVLVDVTVEWADGAQLNRTTLSAALAPPE